MRLHLQLIGCSMLMRELCDAIARSPHAIDAQFLPAGLHDTGAPAMRVRLQKAIDAVGDSGHDYIVLGYALCGTGTVGLQARATPLVLPRAHDCIGLLMGGRAPFNAYFDAHPGTYFRSAGWVERGRQLREQVSGFGVNTPLEGWVARYGEDAGAYLFEQFNRYRSSYSRLAFIRTGLDLTDTFANLAKDEAAEKGWTYAEVNGSLALFRRLLAGDWQDDFLIVPSSHVIAHAFDDRIVEAVPVATGIVEPGGAARS